MEQKCPVFFFMIFFVICFAGRAFFFFLRASVFFFVFTGSYFFVFVSLSLPGIFAVYSLLFFSSCALFVAPWCLNGTSANS